MKLFSNGGKYSADPRNKKKTSSVNPAVEHSVKPADLPSDKVQHSTKSNVVAFPGTTHSQPVQPEQTVTRKNSGKTKKSRLPWVIAALTVIVIVLVAVLFLLSGMGGVNNESPDPADNVQQPEDTLATEAPEIEVVVPTEAEQTEPEPTEATDSETVSDSDTMLPQYLGLYESNHDFFGWIRLANTDLDYPVMRASEESDDYLYSNLESDHFYIGVPYVDYNCSRESDNILLYGDNTDSGGMFHALFEYENQAYWQEHPTIMFSDFYAEYEYEILSVFRDEVDAEQEDSFKFHQFIDAENEEDFAYAVSQFKEKSMYDTGVDAEYGDRLITLITRSYHAENGRFVVVARRK